VNVTKLTENISALKMNDLVVHLGCSLLLTDMIFEPVHSKRRQSLTLSLLAKPVDSTISKRSNSICHCGCLTGNLTVIFSTIQPFSVCKVFISSRSSTVRDFMFITCRVMSLIQHVSNSGYLSNI